MNRFRNQIPQGLQAIVRTFAITSVSVVVPLLTALTAPALAGQQTETGQQRANEGRSNNTTELDIAQACQDAHAIYPAPQNFVATTTSSNTNAGVVNLTWTPVPGLDPSAAYLIQYQIDGAPAFPGVYYVSPELPYNASSFVDSKLPVFYPLRFSISVTRRIAVNIRLANGATRRDFVRCQGAVASSNPPVVVPITSARLRGFVDLHTHPMANVGFGGKLLYGGVDASPNGGALLPTDTDCKHNVRATSEQQALGHDKSTHGGWDAFSNTCGDLTREQIIHLLQFGQNDPSPDASGYPSFTEWPAWNDITHQKMWVEWIRRAYNGGLRVMVALAVNNRTLADLVSGPGDFPTDDKSSADLQLGEMKGFVARHPDFMEIAYSSADVYRIVASNKLALILGIEIDHIGNL